MKLFHLLLIALVVSVSWTSPGMDSVSATYTFSLRSAANSECVTGILADAMRAEGYSVRPASPAILLGQQPARGVMASLFRMIGENVELRMITEIKSEGLLQVNLGHMAGNEIEAIPPPRLTPRFGNAVQRADRECA